jgi:hypothetical protein
VACNSGGDISITTIEGENVIVNSGLIIEDNGSISVATINSTLSLGPTAGITLNSISGAAGMFVGIAPGGTYPSWSYPSAVPTVIISSQITGGTVLPLTVTAADVGRYFTFDTTGTGSWIVNFNVTTFPTNGTFLIKNVSAANHDVTVNFNTGGAATAALVNNPLLHPTGTRNSALCIALWDGTNLFIL